MPTVTVELPSQKSLTAQNLARWSEVMADPKLAALEERIETDRFGHIVMSPPPSAHHGSFQFRIGVLLNERIKEGRVITECPISTADGVKAADVVWASDKRIAELGAQLVFPRSPEICVEVISPGNSEAEIQLKKTLYFDAGALEVWLSSHDGTMRFFAAPGELIESFERLPRFPAPGCFVTRARLDALVTRRRHAVVQSSFHGTPQNAQKKGRTILSGSQPYEERAAYSQ